MTPAGLTSTQLARRLSGPCSPDWLCDEARRGRLVAMKRGHAWVFPAAAVRQAARLLALRDAGRDGRARGR